MLPQFNIVVKIGENKLSFYILYFSIDMLIIFPGSEKVQLSQKPKNGKCEHYFSLKYSTIFN